MADLKESMKTKNVPKKEVIIEIRGSVKNKEVDLRRDLSDAEIVAVIKKVCKELKESADAFHLAGIEYQAKELDSLQKLEHAQVYLPFEISPIDLEDILTEVCSGQTMKDMGKCIGAVKSEVQKLGFDCDGGTVAKLVKEALMLGN